jgi:hypothetical protein
MGASQRKETQYVPTSNSGDMVFADSLASELATVTGGDPTTGYTATFTVEISI